MWLVEKFVPIKHLNGEKRPLPKIIWMTIKERTSSFMSNYWYTYSDWNKIWSSDKIKTEVLFCIARAEWFGKWSWSTWNVMNAGNNDRWDRISFDDWRDSVRSAVSKLNGKRLWNKQTIGDLSYGGHWTIDMKYIYASSTSKRDINVRNCLGQIYNKNIAPSFKFRIQ
jgi:hypothetical protein